MCAGLVFYLMVPGQKPPGTKTPQDGQSDSQEQALKHHEKIEACIRLWRSVKTAKCKFFATAVDILGRQITPDGRRPTLKGIESVINLPSPKNTTELKKFLGMVGFLRDYIRNMSARTLRLRSLLKKVSVFNWDEFHEAEFQEAEFNDLKQSITSPDILLSHPRFDLECEIDTDASRLGMGATLLRRAVLFVFVTQASAEENTWEPCWPSMVAHRYQPKEIIF